jgi:hypothetical protein
MKILLDENFPADFAKLLDGHDATVHSLGWSGIRNGELLRRAHGICKVFVTLDRNLEFQQNIKILAFGVVIVRSRSNRMADLKPLVALILAAITHVSPGCAETVGA